MVWEYDFAVVQVPASKAVKNELALNALAINAAHVTILAFEGRTTSSEAIDLKKSDMESLRQFTQPFSVESYYEMYLKA